MVLFARVREPYSHFSRRPSPPKAPSPVVDASPVPRPTQQWIPRNWQSCRLRRRPTGSVSSLSASCARAPPDRENVIFGALLPRAQVERGLSVERSLGRRSLLPRRTTRSSKARSRSSTSSPSLGSRRLTCSGRTATCCTSAHPKVRTILSSSVTILLSRESRLCVWRMWHARRGISY